MPSDEFLGDRKKALEDSFFAKQNARLVEQLRQKRESEAARAALAEVSGIDDGAVLDRLVELGIGPETWAALSLVPLVEVAWADGRIEDNERRAVMTAAEANGVHSGSASHQLLENWLAQRPDGVLMQVWGEYIVGLCAKLSKPQRKALETDILGRARAVAEAAGGILGLGNKVHPEERRVLSELEKAFDA